MRPLYLVLLTLALCLPLRGQSLPVIAPKVTVFWDAVEGPLAGYMVQWKKSDSQEWKSADAGEETAFDVALTPGVWSVQVCAYSNGGQLGPPSNLGTIVVREVKVQASDNLKRWIEVAIYHDVAASPLANSDEAAGLNPLERYFRLQAPGMP